MRPLSLARHFAWFVVLALAISWSGPALGAPAPSERGGDDALTLRLDDAIGKPGGTVAVVLRTYAARPIRQGRLKVAVRRVVRQVGPNTVVEVVEAGGGPFARLQSVKVFSTAGDTQASSSWKANQAGQPTQVSFSSPSATINAADGPVLVLIYQLAANVVPGVSYQIDLDPALTELVDAGGAPVTIEPRPSELRIRAANGPIAVEAEGDEVEPGEVATVGLHTFEPIPLSRGQMTLLYDPTVVQGVPTVRIDRRFGNSTMTVRRPAPGRLVVKFSSPDKSLNRVPGLLVAVDLQTVNNAPFGFETPLRLDAARTWLFDAQGRKLTLKIENGTLSFGD